MAYGLKYYHDFCDLEGKDQRIAILEKDYLGVSQEVQAAPKPYTKSYESGSDFKFDPIRPSKATINLLYELDFQFSEIWTADETTFKIEIYDDNALDWVGFIVPNGFRRLMVAGKKYLQIDATDGLPLLKTMPFLDTDGKTYGTKDLTYNSEVWFPFSLIATEVLRKLNLDINTWVAVDVYEQSMAKVGNREADPLSNSLVNVKTYINDKTNERIRYWKDAGAAWDCDKVLRNLLYIWGAKIYQEGGVWRIKRVNIDANKEDKYWRKYNTLNVFIGKSALESDLVIPCKSMYDVLVGVDHTVSMDRVFEAVRLNYPYSYERDARESENLITNGNFERFGSQSAEDWIRWSNGEVGIINLEGFAISGENTNGIKTAAQIVGGADPRRELQYAYPPSVTAGDELYLEWWEKIPPNGPQGGKFNGVYRIFIDYDTPTGGLRDQRGTKNARFFLANNGVYRGRFREQESVPMLDAQWTEEPDYFFSYPNLLADRSQATNDYWVRIAVKVPPIPQSGTLRFNIHGTAGVLGADLLKKAKKFPGFYPSGSEWKRGDIYFQTKGTKDTNLQFTGFFFGVAKSTSNKDGEESAPITHNYTVFNKKEYTDRFDPIEIYNGDAEDPNHVSRIRVPTAEPNRPIWNAPQDLYTPSSLGLITAYSILNQYDRPYKMIEGTFALRGIKFGSVIKFASLPGEKFIVQRGQFSDFDRYGNFSGTLVRLVGNKQLDGGYDNGNTVEADWVDTGRSRCYKTSRGGVNTGYVEREQVDINPSSPTANNKAWVLDEDQDLDQCPIGEPSPYWFGSDTIVLDTDNMDYFPVSIDDNEITVPFNNTGGLYQYFLHLDSLGVVESVSTPLQPEIVQDWQYFPDAVIGGYTYRVLRLNHQTGIFKNALITFQLSGL